MTKQWQIGDKIPDPDTHQGRWQIHKIFGGPLKSGMGIVYKVYDHEWHEVLAAKTFQDEIFVHDSNIAELFTREALAWINLDVHQNITKARILNKIEGKPYLFLEYISGGDLGEWIGKKQLMEDLPQILNFAIQFCDGMNHAFLKGINVHRDIKPQNCLITQDKILKITDFGLAKIFDDIHVHQINELTSKKDKLNFCFSRTGMAAGTITHMAPEQFDDFKNVDIRADIYSFGVMLYQMVTGQLPFVGNTSKEFEDFHKNKTPPTRRIQHTSFRKIVETCLSKKPSERYSDFEELRHNLVQLYEALTGHQAQTPLQGVELNAVQWNNKGVTLGCYSNL